MKAEKKLNYNLKGDEEPGVEGPKPQIYHQLGMVIYSWAPIAILQNIAIY